MFVTFEGPEGAGKSTLIRALAEALRADGRDVLVTREPGAGPVGTSIRDILLHGERLDPKSELFLFLADRAQHVASIIRPALENGTWVLCDRHADSTVVYQGYGRGLNLDLLRNWNRFATGGLTPDVTFLLDLDPATGLSRIASKDRLDSEPLDFHRRVRDGFVAEANRDAKRWVILDAAGPPEHVLREAQAVLSERAKTLRP
jgi:dTMP kinase